MVEVLPSSVIKKSNFFRKMGLTLVQVAQHIKRTTLQVGYSEYLSQPGSYVHWPPLQLQSAFAFNSKASNLLEMVFKDIDIYKASLDSSYMFICMCEQADELLVELQDRPCYEYVIVSQVPKDEQYTSSII